MTTSYNRIQAIFITMPAIAALLMTSAVDAQVYKWRDNRGVIQYSDKPPVTGFTKATRNEIVNALQKKDLCAEPTAKTAALASATKKISANFFGATPSFGFGVSSQPVTALTIATKPVVVATAPKPIPVTTKPVSVASPSPVTLSNALLDSPINAALLQEYNNTGLIGGLTVTAWAAASPANATLLQQYKNSLATAGVTAPVTVTNPPPVTTSNTLLNSPTNLALLQEYNNTGLIGGMTVTAWAAASPANAALLQQYKNSLATGGVTTLPVPAPSPAPTPVATAPTTSTPAPSIPNIIQSALLPAVDISKNITPVAGFSGLRIQPTSEQAPQGDEGAFRIACGVSHMSNDDPMVYPNQQGATHHHTFYGNTSVNYKSDLNNLANVGNSTCAGGTMNRSAYWHPTMIDTNTNAPVLPDGGTALFYYKTGYGVPTSSIKAPPKGLRMLVGNPKATSAAESMATNYICEGGVGDGLGWTKYIPNCKVGQKMQMTVQFPQCWDGKNLDSPNHKDHMAYPNGQLANQCPSSHPVAIPLITLNMNFTIKAANQTASWRLASDNYAKNGQNAGYSGHADWVNGWDEATIAGIVRNCLNTSKDAHAHLLCDGRMYN